jgi:hypothetical protein
VFNLGSHISSPRSMGAWAPTLSFTSAPASDLHR